MLGYSAGMLVLLYKIYTDKKNFQNSDSFKIAQSVVDNWNLNFIMDVSATTLDNCLPGYEEALN